MDKVLINDRGEKLRIHDKLANKLRFTFIKNGYVDDEFNLTDGYFTAVEQQNVKLPDELNKHHDVLIELVKVIYVEGKADMLDNDPGKQGGYIHGSMRSNIKYDLIGKLR